MSRRLSLVIASNGMLRVAGGASRVLVGVYVADLARRGFDVGAALVGVLAAISFGAELVGAVPLGLLADAVPTRILMTGGALLAALATVLFGITHEVGVLIGYREQARAQLEAMEPERRRARAEDRRYEPMPVTFAFGEPRA